MCAFCSSKCLTLSQFNKTVTLLCYLIKTKKTTSNVYQQHDDFIVQNQFDINISSYKEHKAEVGNGLIFQFCHFLPFSIAHIYTSEYQVSTTKDIHSTKVAVSIIHSEDNILKGVYTQYMCLFQIC